MNIRQGDVLLQEVDIKIIKDLKAFGSGKITLAYGEVTGHSHVLQGNKIKHYESNGQRLVQLEEPAELVHEEHDTQKVPAGIYLIVLQREYDLVDGIRQVSD